MRMIVDARNPVLQANEKCVTGWCRSGSLRHMLDKYISELLGQASDFRRFVRWREVVRYALESLGGEASFADIIDRIERIVPTVWLHRYWEARVLRIIRKDSEIEKVAHDRWRLRPPSAHRGANSS
jgi:hypothetical protein